MSFVAVAIGGGLGLAGVGSFMGAQSQNKAANRQRDAQVAEAQAARDRQGFLMFGPQDWADFNLAMSNPISTTGGGGGFLGFGKKKGRTVDNSAAVRAAQNRFFGKYGNGYDTIDKANKTLLSDSEAGLATTMANTRQIDSLNRGSEDAVAAFGNAGEDRINRQAADALTAANQRSQASLGALGVNTLVANQQGQNAARINQGKQDALTALQANQLDRRLQARGMRTQQLFGRKAIEESTRSALNQTRYGASTDNANRMLSMFSGGSFSPYTPLQGGGQSALGSLFGSVGSGLTSVGGYAWGQQQPPKKTG